MKNKHLQFKKEITWDDVWNVWKNTEGQDPVWQQFAKDVKGWNSWEEWRGYQSSLLEPEKMDWKLYEITDPTEFIPYMRMGPYKGWQQHFEEKNVKTFQDLVQEKTDWVRENTGVKHRLDNFPQETQFIGLYLKDEDAYVMYEGHHRAAAIALADYEGKEISFEQLPKIAIAEIEIGGRDLMERLLDMSTENPNKHS